MTVTLEALRSKPKYAELLFPFEFRLLARDEHHSWFEIDGCERLTIIAEDSAGGPYLLWGPERHLVYVTSEGQVGVIAASLAEGIELIVTYPYWQVLLRQGCDGDFAGVTQAIPDQEESYLDAYPEVADNREILRAELGLPVPDDPVALIRSLCRAFKVLGRGLTVFPCGDRSYKYPSFLDEA
jgi:hypothetical protein